MVKKSNDKFIKTNFQMYLTSTYLHHTQTLLWTFPRKYIHIYRFPQEIFKSIYN